MSYTYIHIYIYICREKSADPSACGLLSSICFDSKSEVKRSEVERSGAKSEAKGKRSEKRSEATAKRKAKRSRSEAID